MDGLDWWRWLLLAVMFGGLGWAAWWAKRRGAGSGSAPGRGRLRVVERCWLDARTSVAVVECDGRTFLLARQAGGALAWQPVEPPPPTPPPR